MPTLTQLRDIVRRDEAFNSTTVISDANLNILLNEAAVDLANRADAFILNATWSGVASTQLYVLSGATPKVTGFLDLYWPAGGLVYTQTTGQTKTAPRDFRFVSEAWLDLNFPAWQDDSASDSLQDVYLTYDTSGFLNLGVHPKTSSTAPTFKLYYKSRGTDMTADGHYPWTGSTTNMVHTEPYQKAIAYYAMWHLAKTKTRIDEDASHYLELYGKLVQDLKDVQYRLYAMEQQGSVWSGQLSAQQTFGGSY